MRLSTIRAQNFKGRSFEHDLAPVTVWTGANFAGKTARLDAITLALTGQHPACDKTGVAIFQTFGGNGPLAVDLELGGGKACSRSWERIDGSIRSQSEFRGITEVEWGKLFPPVMLNAREYFDRSNRERVKMVFDLVKLPPGSGPLGIILEQIQNAPLSSGRMAGPLNDLVQEIESSQRQGQSMQEWIEGLAKEFGQRKKDADAEARRYSGVQVNFTTEPAKDVGQQIQKIKSELDELNRKIGGLEERARRAQGSEARRKEIQTELNAIPKPQEIEKLRAELKRLERNYRSETGVLKVKEAEFAGDIKSLDKQVDLIGAEIRILNSEHEKLMGHVNCPTCDAEGSSWWKRVGVVFKKKLEGLKAAESVATKSSEKKNLALIEVQKAIKRSEEMDEANEDRELRIEILKSSLSHADSFDSLRSKLTKELEELKNEDAKSLGDQIADARQRRGLTMDTLQELQASERQWIEQQAQRKRCLEVEEIRVKAGIDLEVAKIAVKAITAAQAKLAEQVFGTLMKTVNEIAGPIMKQPLAYRDGEIGYEVSGKFVLTDAFSGTEQAISYAALSLALAVQSPVKILMLDEVGRLDVENREKLARLVVKLQRDGVIDQSILVDTDSQIYRSIEGLEIIEV